MWDGLPDGPLLAWYGDDFTGAAAVLEALTFSGLPSALFFDLPTKEQLAKFPDLKGIGIASTSRTLDPSWMSQNLPNAFKHLASLGPQFVHYKTCSTLDSSPEVGSIGRAIDIGIETFRNRWVPVIIAAPQMRRYQCFGNLFAGTTDGVYRLDRHPVMSRHPVTPMNEANVARHLERQTDLKIDTIDLEALSSPAAAQKKLDQLTTKDTVVATIDSIDAGSEAAVGRLVWENRDKVQFIVGSQGVEYALIRHLINENVISQEEEPPAIDEVDVIAVVSGSVSPTTADQINWSLNNGFAGIHFDASAACGSGDSLAAIEHTVLEQALNALSKKQSPLIYTAIGPDDPAVNNFRNAVSGSNSDIAKVNQRVGETLGRILGSIVDKGKLRRAVISGGDTSGYAARQLGIFALTALAPTIPGAAIFQAHADGHFDGLELALKGGQMGSPDYFGRIRAGGGV